MNKLLFTLSIIGACTTLEAHGMYSRSLRELENHYAQRAYKQEFERQRVRLLERRVASLEHRLAEREATHEQRVAELEATEPVQFAHTLAGEKLKLLDENAELTEDAHRANTQLTQALAVAERLSKQAHVHRAQANELREQLARLQLQNPTFGSKLAEIAGRMGLNYGFKFIHTFCISAVIVPFAPLAAATPGIHVALKLTNNVSRILGRVTGIARWYGIYKKLTK